MLKAQYLPEPGSLDPPFPLYDPPYPSAYRDGVEEVDNDEDEEDLDLEEDEDE